MIRKELIVIDSDVENRDSTLSLLIEKADRLGLLNDKEVYRKAVDEREETMPTSLGFSVAIPHGKCDGVKEPFVGILRSKKEFIWNTQNNNPVQLVFLIGVPEKNAGKLHLKFLSEISKKILHEEFRDQLMSAKTEDEIFDLLSEINEKVR